MGCVSSLPVQERPAVTSAPEVQSTLATVWPKATTKYARPRWKSPEPITLSQLQKHREEFWDTQPHYGGDRNIWDALKAACDAEPETCKILIESAGIIVAAPDMTVCYDERGAKYDLPKYVLSYPANLIMDK